FLYTYLRAPRPTLFPYTTLFRSWSNPLRPAYRVRPHPPLCKVQDAGELHASHSFITIPGGVIEVGHEGPSFHFDNEGPRHQTIRSEEHTSELQSRENLVCRLLLE